jgi:hypothetical protein
LPFLFQFALHLISHGYWFSFPASFALHRARWLVFQLQSPITIPIRTDFHIHTPIYMSIHMEFQVGTMGHVHLS